jgi:hypothetical protein
MKKIYFIFLVIAVFNKISYAQPVNDDCAGATEITLTGMSGTISGQTTDATQSIPPINCMGTSSAALDVWYKFIAPSANTNITVSPSGLDVIADLRSGSCDGTNINCSDGGGSGASETINATNLTVGDTYYLRVYGYGISTGTFFISINGITPTYDDCAGATEITITGMSGSISGQTTVGATQSIPPINCMGTSSSALDVWYNFVAPSANTNITVAPSGFDVIADLRSGSCSGTNINCSDGGGTGAPETINATGLNVGDTYYLRVYGYGTATGTFSIAISDVSVNTPSTVLTEENVSISPNPFNNQSIITFPENNNENFVLTIMDIQGRQVIQRINVSGKYAIIYRENLKQGMYLFTLHGEDSGSVYIGKFIIYE